MRSGKETNQVIYKRGIHMLCKPAFDQKDANQKSWHMLITQDDDAEKKKRRG